jgi:hypothetical protein
MDKVNFGDNRWKIIYGKYEGVEKTSLDILYGAVSQYTEYILTSTGCDSIEQEELNNINPIFIGTKDSNKYISSFLQKGIIESNNKEEGYSIKVTKSIFNEEKQMIIILGNDDNGVVYGAVDFENKYLANAIHTNAPEKKYNNLFCDQMPEYEKVSAPCIKNRAIWTWGHVIYDYQKFIDNMTRLKLNMIVIWNDYVPVNARDMVEYAHLKGIKVIWGYSWGWGVDVDISSSSNMEKWAEIALLTYKEKYAELNGDGIYFQSFTETKEDTLNGVLIAEAVTNWVNVISNILLEEYPSLDIQFGLHATSVNNQLEFIRNIDKRIHIIWEDCGAFPYHYIPQKVEEFEETKIFSSKIATLRGKDDRFGTVFKGLICLDWMNFEHQKDSFLVGKSTSNYISGRTEEKSRYWRYVQAYWLRNACYIQEMIRQFVLEKGEDVTIEALVEDGMFESKLWYPVVLYAEMLWDCNLDLKDLLCNVALMPDVYFA